MSCSRLAWATQSRPCSQILTKEISYRAKVLVAQAYRVLYPFTLAGPYLACSPRGVGNTCQGQSLTPVLLLQISLASRTPKDQGMCHVLEQVCSMLKQGS